MSIALAIEALQQALPDVQLYVQGTDEFNKLNASYLSALESDITPAAIILPKTSKHVSTFLRTIGPFVTNGQTTFAVRGAGQQPLPGCANIQGGITLDLALLTGIKLDFDSRVVSIGAGERWGAVYEKLSGHGLSITGSRSAKGGIGGLALAGGLSFFSTREGFICDNVVTYEIVLASGEVVKCSVDNNPDLYKCLRGGGNNFGIVTKYDMRTFTQGPFWGGNVFYYPASFPNQVDALVHHLQDAQIETHVMVSLFFAAQFGATLGLNQVYYTREIKSPPVLDPFVNIQPQLDDYRSLRMINAKDAAGEQASMSANGKRVAYVNTTVKADAATLKAAADIFTASLNLVQGCKGVVFSLTFQPYPMSLLEKCLSAGGNITGLTPADGPLVSVLVLMNWEDKDDDKTILGTARSILEAIDKDAAARGQAVSYKYLNYAFDFQDPIGSYGAENKQFLQDVSKRVDPDGVFQQGVPGGFKLFS
ncbi:FAD-binding domain-containing protein [Xylaria bambusicola]|uniref:FAD-binding domain-containing protein n=1 Tax=Xylaria bambusicola TaxID=326684 RepID=UPI002007FFFD|nr:FAD-binding domain-containing protein [Xylaria bambusicola]KAI0502861.1 FAD-binding domain-containing protein [Xylaria bambusicola]